jgi:hypothetical protein
MKQQLPNFFVILMHVDPLIMKAFKLISKENGDSSFLEGEVPTMTHIKANYFFVQNHIEHWENGAHCAPRYQFVITVKGKLKFKVTNGDTFVIEPGVILIANDLTGKGHTWEILEGPEWHRIYVVPEEEVERCFVEKK